MLGFNQENARMLIGIPFALAWMAVGYILWSGGSGAAHRPAPAKRMESVP